MVNGHLLTDTVLEKKQPVEPNTKPEYRENNIHLYGDNESVYANLNTNTEEETDEDNDNDDEDEESEDW